MNEENLFLVVVEFLVKAKDLPNAIEKTLNDIDTDNYCSVSKCEEVIFNYEKTSVNFEERFSLSKIKDKNLNQDLWYVKDNYDDKNPISGIVGEYTFINKIYKWLKINYS